MIKRLYYTAQLIKEMKLLKKDIYEYTKRG